VERFLRVYVAMKTISNRVRSISICILSLGLFFSVPAALSEEPVKVGVILPLTGQATHVGKAIQNGMELAYQDLPETTKKKMTLLYEDDGMLPRNSIASFRKLLTLNRISVVVNASSQTGLALAPLVERERLPFIVIARDPKIVEDRNYVMTFWNRAEDEVKATLAEMKCRGIERVAIVSASHEGSVSFQKSFKSLSAEVAEVLLDEEFSSDETDFRTFIARLNNLKDLEGLIVLLQPGQIGLFARQLQQNQLTVPLIGYNLFKDRKEVEVADGALEGAWFVSPGAGTPEFWEKYKAAYPDDSDSLAAHGYDIVMLIAEAVESGRTPQEINQYLHRVVDFSGALGTYSASPANNFDLPLSVLEISGDDFKDVSSSTCEKA